MLFKINNGLNTNSAIASVREQIIYSLKVDIEVYTILL